MNVKQRFNKTIQEIEKRAGDPYVDSQELAADIAASNALLLRDMITVFKYLTGNTLRAYISDRRMMASYKFLITGKTRNIERALKIAGYGDQPGYTKAFKKRFGISPGEAFKKKDVSLYEEPLSWEQLSQEAGASSGKEDVAVQETETHFGIKLNQFDKISKAMELEAFYEFSPVFSQFAFDLSEKISKPLSDEKTLRNRRLQFYLRNGYMETTLKSSVFGVSYRLLEASSSVPHSARNIRDAYIELYRSILPAEFFRTQFSVSN